MKIAAIEPILIKVPFQHGGPPPRGDARPWSTMDTLLVKVTTDDGLIGWGEAFGFGGCATTRTAIETLIAPLAVGREADDIAGLTGEIARRLHNFGRNGPVPYAISGLDIALWDIAGQRAGAPVWRLLGGAPITELPAYASLMRYGTPELVARNAGEAAGRGYREVKLHEVGVAQIAAGRAAVGPDIPLTVDANCPWTAQEAIDIARELVPLNLKWLEEPVWPPEDHASLARLASETGIAVASGENASTLIDFERLMDVGRVAFIQPSVTKIGGITAMRQVVAMAAARGTRVAPHSAYFGPGLIATLHVIAALVPQAACERLYCDLAASPFGDQVDAPGGRMRVPDAPGLGLAIDVSVIERYRVA